MTKISVGLSFDDGRKDNYRVAKILKKNNIPATFNITTSYVDGRISWEDAPCKNKSMSVENIIKLYELGFEIAGHGDCHKNTLSDIRKGIWKLKNWLLLDENDLIGFASPDSNLSEVYIAGKKEQLKNAGIQYVRIAGRKVPGFRMRVIRKLAHLTGSTILYRTGFRDALTDRQQNTFIVHSVPVMRQATIRQIQAIILEAVKSRKNCILMFHSIVKSGEPFYKDAWSWDYEKFLELCVLLKKMRKKGLLDICTIKDIAEKGIK